MADAVTICNLALSYLGDEATVASIDPPEKSAQARLCATYYPVARDALLSMHDWAFATRVREAPALEEESKDGWLTVCAVPSDCIPVIKVRDAQALDAPCPYPSAFRNFVDGEPEGAPFTVQGNNIYTSASSPVVTYTSNAVSESQFPPAFVTALAYYLAVELAGARVTGQEGRALASSLQKSFQVALAAARSRDAAQQQKHRDFIPKWLRVR